MPPPTVNKLVLAVHGIGDQTENSTILSTATQFCQFYGYRALIPLGAFYDLPQEGQPPFVVSGPATPDGLATIGFAEVYWADIARGIETAGFTLQETKDWCRSVVSRVNVLAERREPGRTDIHYEQIEYVLEEAIDAIGVMEALLFLAKKAGVLDFDLKRVLDDYLGDVQLVTEFTHVRDLIVLRMQQALKTTYRNNPEAEIYIVAHSEGTVVAFLGLLHAATNPQDFPWIRQVRGFMTLGSPIDKHIILWPDLFASFAGPNIDAFFGNPPSHRGPVPLPPPPIRWLNYVDNGDPVGFELDTARWWLQRHGYDQIFHFTANDDYYFTRYPVPGKAHTDYWNDPDVFQHFIMTVVAPPKSRDDPPTIAIRERLKNGPPPKFWSRISSYVAAYLIPLVAIFAATYFLCKGVEQYLDPKGEADHPHLIRNVALMGGLLAGATVYLRITQLVRSLLWQAFGLAIYLITAGLFYFGMVRTNDLRWFGALPAQFGGNWADPRNGILLISAGLVVLTLLANARWLRRIWTDLVHHSAPMGAVATLQPTGSAPSSAPEKKATAIIHKPFIRNTLRVMIILGGSALVLNAIVYNSLFHPAKAPLWPIVMGSAAFLFLWRLAALVFDLVFLWHRYIRFSGAMNFLRHAILPSDAENMPTATGGRGKAKK